MRAQNATFFAENDGLRARLEDARRRFTATEGDFVLQSHELDRARERAWARRAARRGARGQVRQAAADAPGAGGGVGGVGQGQRGAVQRARGAARFQRGERDEGEELTARLSSAQRLYLAGQKSFERAEELREATAGSELERKLDALLTPEMLARSRPPPSLSGALALPVDGVVLLRRRRRRGARRRSRRRRRRPTDPRVAHLRSAESRRGKLQAQGSARKGGASRRGARRREQEANGALAELTKGDRQRSRRHNAQLTGALRRLQWLVERQGRLEAGARKKTRTRNRWSGGC